MTDDLLDVDAFDLMLIMLPGLSVLSNGFFFKLFISISSSSNALLSKSFFSKKTQINKKSFVKTESFNFQLRYL